MPWLPQKYCAQTGCGELVPKGYCKEHTKQKRKRETWRAYNTTEWKEVRKQVLAREPQCRLCAEPATVVDHIQTLKSGGTHNINNLRPLCKPCHDKHTYTHTLKKNKG